MDDYVTHFNQIYLHSFDSIVAIQFSEEKKSVVILKAMSCYMFTIIIKKLLYKKTIRKNKKFLEILILLLLLLLRLKYSQIILNLLI